VLPNRSSSARIAAPEPLLRAGLERIALAAGVDPSESVDADFVLRSFEVAPSDVGIDVAIEHEAVVITCHGVPEPSVWAALHRILAAAATG
jgi:hypothetical protein